MIFVHNFLYWTHESVLNRVDLVIFTLEVFAKFFIPRIFSECEGYNAYIHSKVSKSCVHRVVFKCIELYIDSYISITNYYGNVNL